MQQNAAAARAPPGPRWRSLQRPLRPLAGPRGAASRRGGEGRKKGEKGNAGEGKGEEGQGGRGRGGEGRLTLMRSWNRVADWLRPTCIVFFEACDTIPRR